jgi:hypothetical protein
MTTAVKVDPVTAAALRHNLDPRIFAALVRQESGGRQGARSPAGAIGETQLMPGTAASLGVDPYDQEQNLDGGAKYLRQQLDRFGGDYAKALAAYNAGPGAVEKYNGVPPFAETQAYVKAILGSTGAPAKPAAMASRYPAPATASPAVDNSGLRRQVVADFLAAGGVKSSAATAALATGYRAAADTPGAAAPTSTAAPVAASGVPSQLKTRADEIDAKHLPYQWGGGHAGKVDAATAQPLDCSGAVSAVLGINPRVASQFETWGKPGDGGSSGVTIYSKSTHVLMSINGHFFGTSATNPGGGAGWIPRSAIDPAYLKGFTARHL